MILTSDYHTHTIYSHGKGTVLDNALAAKEIGLKEIAISDHGFAHPAFGLRKRKVDSLIADCKDATEKTGVKVLVGIESNIVSDKGKCDLPVKLYDKFDVFLMGMHQFILYTPPTFVKLFLPDFFCNTFKTKPAKWMIKENTKAFINAIKKCPIDVVTHLNYKCFTDVIEVAKCAADYGTYLELNSKKTHFTDDELFALVNTGVNFVIDSDAHSPNRVGDFELVKQQLERVSVPIDRIHNVDGKLPDFRFAKFKNGSI